MAVQWLIELLQDFETFTPLNKLVTLLAIGTPVGAGVAWLRSRYKYGLTSLEEKIAELERRRDTYEAENKRLRTERASLEERVAGLEARVAAYVLERAARERRDQNDEQAVHLERSLLETEGAELAAAAADVCRYHLAMATNPTEREHLAAAERFATLAAHLDPAGRGGWRLLVEVKQLVGSDAFAAGDFAAAARNWDEALDYPDATDAAEMLPHLIDRIDGAWAAGLFQQMLALASGPRRLLAANSAAAIRAP